MSSDFSNATKDEIENFYHQISKNVSIKRKEKGLSQLELALEIGIKSAAFYSNCENNRYNKHFNLEHLYKIAKALDISIEQFFENN